jgi:predicted Zn-dependent protease with MMP-like domain
MASSPGDNSDPPQSLITAEQLYETLQQLEGQLEGIGLFVMSYTMAGQVVPDYVFTYWLTIHEKWQAIYESIKPGIPVSQIPQDGKAATPVSKPVADEAEIGVTPQNIEEARQVLYQLAGQREGLSMLMVYYWMKGETFPDYIFTYLIAIHEKWQTIIERFGPDIIEFIP